MIIEDTKQWLTGEITAWSLVYQFAGPKDSFEGRR
jgi:hypothetical protein